MEIQPFHKPKGIHNAIIQKGWSKWGNWGWATLIHWKIMEINQNLLNLWFNIFFSALFSTNKNNTSAWSRGKRGNVPTATQKTSVRLEELLLRTVMALNAGRCFSVMIIDACWWYLWHPQCILTHTFFLAWTMLKGVKSNPYPLSIFGYTPRNHGP